MTVFDEITAVLQAARDNASPIDPEITTLHVSATVRTEMQAYAIVAGAPFASMDEYVAVPVVTETAIDTPVRLIELRWTPSNAGSADGTR